MSGAPSRGRLAGSSRYELLVRIASGGAATVYVGRVAGTSGLSRLVAIKRAHPHLLEVEATRKMLVDEAAMARAIEHANVVSVKDVEETATELLLVMDYVEGASLGDLLAAAAAKKVELSPRIAVRVLLDVCAGLAAVHAAMSKEGDPLGLVHRDVSPQNILVGVDGTARLTDFGLAKSSLLENSRTTGVLKGKLAYMPPEYVQGQAFLVPGDVFAMGIVAWEALANRRLYRGENEADTIRRVVSEAAPKLSSVVPSLGSDLDAVIGRALEKEAPRRFARVADFAAALGAAARRKIGCATHEEVGAEVKALAGDVLERRREVLAASMPGPDAMVDTVSLLHAVAEDWGPLLMPGASAKPARPERPEYRQPGEATATLSLPAPTRPSQPEVPPARESWPARDASEPFALEASEPGGASSSPARSRGWPDAPETIDPETVDITHETIDIAPPPSGPQRRWTSAPPPPAAPARALPPPSVPPSPRPSTPPPQVVPNAPPIPTLQGAPSMAAPNAQPAAVRPSATPIPSLASAPLHETPAPAEGRGTLSSGPPLASPAARWFAPVAVSAGVAAACALVGMLVLAPDDPAPNEGTPTSSAAPQTTQVAPSPPSPSQAPVPDSTAVPVEALEEVPIETSAAAPPKKPKTMASPDGAGKTPARSTARPAEAQPVNPYKTRLGER